ncbi:glycoside hydrolase domain-containing protein [Serinibacter salmoneus]|uniref:Putative alpha-1,2-mannosidase n=1 Tax=Serinibacter salmoneus TaxID=556530 RepID=A0A2A9D0A5_9MICO|nr:glycoside hydrolase domain-containing protein [Serinibacter salmoneus]PFG19821.1 putative alpha-1,2-mannosidase [Serinibacter salmoneus]
MLDSVDPFIGTLATDLPPRSGLAATWWWPKPQVGNTHPGAAYPLGMVSACAYSGAYPCGYGSYDLGTEGLPVPIRERHEASGFSHFQQSGTGAIRKYYNYMRVTPMQQPLDDLGATWAITEEEASPGYYRAMLDSGIQAELTVGPKSAVHRYTFPASDSSRVVIDLSMGGLQLPYGETVPLRARLDMVRPGVACGEITVEGAPLAVHIECDAPMRQLLWYDRRLMPGGSRLEFSDIRPTTLRPFGLMFVGPTEAGQTVEIRMGFSLRGTDQAEANLRADVGEARPAFDVRHHATRREWARNLGAIEVATPNAERETVYATALYHSLIKPCFGQDESPYWPMGGPFVFDLCTMWDIYRTQLPLLGMIRPDAAAGIATSLLRVAEEEGNFPIGYRMARGADRFSRQASALAHTLLADLCLRGPRRGGDVDWEWALVHMQTDLRRTYGEEYLRDGVAHPISHTLDLAFGYWCTQAVADRVGDATLLKQFAPLASGWRAAFDPETGLLLDSTYYEGGKWNYSFRLVHDMARRITLAGGDEEFTGMLDRFFGYGADPVRQPGMKPSPGEMRLGYGLNRFEGMNNEPDMEAPWAYTYAGRPDRTAEVVHAAVHQTFAASPGGLAGNDDSGGLSSWYVWAALGLFPVAGQDIVLLNAPSFSSADIQVPEGTLSIRTKGFREPDRDGPPQYVTRATLDGQRLDRAWVTGDRLYRGGELVFTLADAPSDWGRTDRPPSGSYEQHQRARARDDQRRTR